MVNPTLYGALIQDARHYTSQNQELGKANNDGSARSGLTRCRIDAYWDGTSFGLSAHVRWRKDTACGRTVSARLLSMHGWKAGC